MQREQLGQLTNLFGRYLADASQRDILGRALPTAFLACFNPCIQQHWGQFQVSHALSITQCTVCPGFRIWPG